MCTYNTELMKYTEILCMAVIVLMTSASCVPSSKDKYLQEFDGFIQEVSDNYKTYTEQEWARMSEKYEKFVGEWYDKYESELTTKEELHVISNQTKWFYFEKVMNGISALDEAVQSIDTEKLKKDIEFYVKNDMMDDLENLYDSAVKKGKEAEKAVKELLEEMDVAVDDIRK